MTKPVSAVAVLLLVQDGLLSLDDELAKHLHCFVGATNVLKVVRAADEPPISEARRAVQIRDVLTHTAGLPLDYSLVFQQVASVVTPENFAERPLEHVVEAMAALPLTNHPGEEWAYGNGFDVLGLAAGVTSAGVRDVWARADIADATGAMLNVTVAPMDSVFVVLTPK